MYLSCVYGVNMIVLHILLHLIWHCLRNYFEAIHGAELESEKLRGMLRAEGAALEGCRRLKGESEKHMSEVLDNYRK
mgnify:CR=1 FL=1